MEKYVVLEKAVGETPLACAEAWRAAQPPAYADTPMAYAGRLDPMASGKLLLLLGDECKNQAQYHGLDKEYEFSVLFGIASDTHDVLGRLKACPPKTGTGAPREVVRLGLAARTTRALPFLQSPNGSLKIRSDATEGGAPVPVFSQQALIQTTQQFIGSISLPYPLFSSKTVKGKPLHTWTLEGRLDEIEIPTNSSTIYELGMTKVEQLARDLVVDVARAKIETIPPVTDLRKAIGNDFRRVDVRKDWAEIASGNFGPTALPDTYTIAHFRCISSSGTYMRSLAHLIGQKLGTCGLAWHIHRTKIGSFDSVTKKWTKEYA